MTDHTNLIARLRDWRGDPDEVMQDAADALEYQAKLIEQFGGISKDAMEQCFALTKERDQLRAEVVDAKEIQTELQEVITEMCNAIPDYDWSGGAAEKIKDAFTRLKALESERAGIIQRSNEIISSLAAGAAPPKEQT